MVRRCLILSFLVLFAQLSRAQHPFYYTITDDNGLPSNEVYDIEQDSFGYIWIGCDAGLFRYDGFRFVQHSNKGQNAVAMSNLHLAESGKVYCQNFFGQIFCAVADSLAVLADLKDLISIHPEYTVDTRGNVWVGMPDGILKYNTDGTKEHLFKGKLSVAEIEIMPNGSIYVLDLKEGLLVLSEARGEYTMRQIAGASSDNGNSRYTLRKYGDRLFMLTSHNISNSHSIVEIKGEEIRIIKELESGAIAKFIYALAFIEGKLWLGTSSGAYRMNFDGVIEQHLFANEKVSDIYRDREGTFWFSTLQNGIYVVPDMGVVVLNTSNSALKDNNITALRALEGQEMLAGTYTGDLYRLSLETGRLDALPRDKKAIYRNVTSIIPYSRNIVVAARGGISVINTATNTESEYSSVYIRDMTRMGDSIMIASTGGIRAVTGIGENKNALRTELVNNTSSKRICFDKSSGMLWVTINGGLATLRNGDIRIFPIDGKPAFCNALFADDSGLWAGTISDGVYNIRGGKVVLHLDKRSGLLGNNVKCITTKHDTLYVATDKCINVRYPNGHFAYVGLSYGVNPREVNSISIQSPYMFVGTIRGLYSLPVHHIVQNHVRPNIRLTSVSAGGVRHDPDNPLELTYNNKDILVDFSATAFRSRGRFYYMYRILGFQEEWRLQDANINTVQLSHLPAGSFVFEVKAVNEDNLSSPQVARLIISVNAPFWEQWWFYVLIVLFASVFVAVAFQLRIRTIRRKADLRDQVTTSQLTALKAQMNPHFMYNTLNSIQDLVLQKDIKNTNYYLSRYSSLMRKILESSGSNEIDLEEEIEMLQLYLELEQLRFGRDFSYSIVCAPDIDRHATTIPSMLIQPFVENALKHGLLHKKGNKRLDISFNRVGENIICVVTDNGVGRKKAAEIKSRSAVSHKSFATQATEKRLALINAGRASKVKLEIEDLVDEENPCGTRVSIWFPVSGKS